MSRMVLNPWNSKYNIMNSWFQLIYCARWPVLNKMKIQRRISYYIWGFEFFKKLLSIVYFITPLSAEIEFHKIQALSEFLPTISGIGTGIANYLKNIDSEHNSKLSHNTTFIYLERIISFCDHHNVLLLVDNYFYTNIISNNTTPYILRRLVPGFTNATIKHQNSGVLRVSQVTWISSTATAIRSGHIPYCSLSKYLSTNTFAGDPCTKIQPSFALNTKPWNQVVVLSVLLPNLVLGRFAQFLGSAAAQIRINLNLVSVFIPLPSTQSQVLQIYILNNSISNIVENNDQFRETLRNSWLSTSGTTSADTILFMTTLQQQKWFASKISIRSLYVYCYLCMQTTLKHIALHEFYNNPFITNYAFPKNNEMTAWSVTQTWTAGDLFNVFAEEMGKCSNDIHKLGHHWYLNKSQSFIVQQVQAYASIWQTIMGNFSYHIDGMGYKCTNFVKVRAIPPAHDLLIHLQGSLYSGRLPGKFMVAVPSKLNSLLFVACGDNRLIGLDFGEFTSIFDKFIWIFIGITMFASASILSFLSGSKYSVAERFIEQTYIVAGFFLEKGDNDGNPNGKRKFTVGILLLTIMILSNAYKNDNVYRMIKQRPRFNYDTFDEIFSRRFNIYSRGSSIFLFPNMFPKIGNLSETYFDKVDGFFKYDSDLQKLQIALLRTELTNLVISGGLELAKNTSTEFKLVNKVKVHFLTIGLLKRFIVREFKRPKENWTSFHRDEIYKQHLKAEFRKLEHDLFVKELTKCEHMALTFSLYEAHEFWKLMKFAMPQHLKGSLHLGKQTVFKGSYAFNLRGRVPQFILKRLKLVKTSSIFEWWTKNIENRAVKKYDNVDIYETPQSASINGNISTIFIILLAGITASIGIAISEKMYHGKKAILTLAMQQISFKSKIRKIINVMYKKTAKVFRF